MRAALTRRWALPAAVLLAAAGIATPASADATRLSSQDRAFVKHAGHGGAFEVAAGRIATQRGHHKGVRAFGSHMVADHTKANAVLHELGEDLGIDVPDGPDEHQQVILALFDSVTGPVFDCSYAPTEYLDHVATIGVFEKEAEHGRNSKLRSFARKTLPVLHEHREEIADTLADVRCTAPVPLPTPIPVPGD
jgi:putative membrane protein